MHRIKTAFDESKNAARMLARFSLRRDQRLYLVQQEDTVERRLLTSGILHCAPAEKSMPLPTAQQEKTIAKSTREGSPRQFV